MPVSIGPRSLPTKLLHVPRRQISPVLSVATTVHAAPRLRTVARHFSVTPAAASTTRRNDNFNTGYTNEYLVPSYGDGRGPIFDKKETRVLYPRDIKRRLDAYVVGQEKAKKVICTSIFNHIKRFTRAEEYEQYKLREQEREKRLAHVADRDRQHASYSAGPEDEQAGFRQSEFLSQTQFREPPIQQAPFQAPKPMPPPKSFFRDDMSSNWVKIDKSNLLFLGPTGSGKTYLLETVSKLLDLPLVICDCNALTQAGYIGQDVETCIQRLLIESNFDVQRAQSGIVVLDEFDKLARREVTAGRDVAGEGVQQALLTMVHGASVTVTIKESHKPATTQNAPFGLQNQSMLAGAQSSPAIKPEQQYTVDTSNIMFVFCGAFAGLEKIIKKRVAKTSMGFMSAAHALERKSQVASLASTTGKEPPPEAYLDLATPNDLQAFGIIPELLGRIHDVCSLSQLSVDELYRILTEPVNNLVAQYQTLMKTYPSDVFFTKKALRAIAKRAADSKKGARGLNTEMLRILRDGMFIAPLPYILVTEACVEDPEKLLYWGKDGRMELERIMREEDWEDARPSHVERPRAAEVGAG